jgi:hypothetical protein
VSLPARPALPVLPGEVRTGLAPAAAEIARLATGDAALDGLLGGGFARGQLTEIVGPSSSGRTSIAYRLLAGASLRSEVTALVDTADRFDPARAAAAGIDLARLLWIRPPDPTAALRASEVLLATRGFAVVVLDLAEGLSPSMRARLATAWSRLRLRAAASRAVLVLLARERLSGGAADLCLALGARKAIWSRAPLRTTLLSGIECGAEIVRTRHGAPGARERLHFDEG